MPSAATTLILDCGTLTGHQQRELELPRVAVPYFGIDPDGLSHATYIRVNLSNGSHTFLRMIYRDNNGMWRVEFTTTVPEIQAGIIPPATADGEPNRRSDHAAVFTKVGNEESAAYNLRFLQVGSADYDAELAHAAAGGTADRTAANEHGRNFGWY